MPEAEAYENAPSWFDVPAGGWELNCAGLTSTIGITGDNPNVEHRTRTVTVTPTCKFTATTVQVAPGAVNAVTVYPEVVNAICGMPVTVKLSVTNATGKPIVGLGINFTEPSVKKSGDHYEADDYKKVGIVAKTALPYILMPHATASTVVMMNAGYLYWGALPRATKQFDFTPSTTDYATLASPHQTTQDRYEMSFSGVGTSGVSLILNRQCTFEASLSP